LQNVQEFDARVKYVLYSVKGRVVFLSRHPTTWPGGGCTVM